MEQADLSDGNDKHSRSIDQDRIPEEFEDPAIIDRKNTISRGRRGPIFASEGIFGWEDEQDTYLDLGSSVSRACSASRLSFSKRIECWELQRVQRLRELQRSHDAQELAECSFQPQVPDA